MIALAAAFFTAGLALFAKVAYDFWERYQERSGLAGSLAGEIGAYISLLNAPVAANAMRGIAAFDREKRCRRLRAFPVLPVGHPVFDKVSGKIGILPIDVAQQISEFYNIVTNLRIWGSTLASGNFLATDDEHQISMLNVVADSLEKKLSFAPALVGELTRLSADPFSGFICEVLAKLIARRAPEVIAPGPSQLT